MAAFAKTKEATINIPTLELHLKQDFTVWCQGRDGKYTIYRLTNNEGKLLVADVRKDQKQDES